MAKQLKSSIDLNQILLQENSSKKIKNYKCDYLTDPGENYGSIMYALEITIEDLKTGKEEIINAAAKLVPENEFIQFAFNITFSFKKEYDMYKTILPILQEFQRKNGITDVLDIAPKFYGGIFELKPNNQLSTNSIIILENLKYSNYTIVDRLIGFDLKASKVILSQLAKFHAVSIGLKFQQPEVFNKHIAKFTGFHPFNIMSEKSLNARRKIILKLIEEDEEIREYLHRFDKAYRHSEWCFRNPIRPNTPFLTLSHSDFWINNILIQFDDKGNPIKTKFIDFQIVDCNSPGHDIALFFFINAQSDVVTNHYEDLITEYFNSFIGSLQELNLDTEIFTLEGLEKEIERSVQEHMLFQGIMTLKTALASRDSVQDVEEQSMDLFEKDEAPSDLYKSRLRLIVKHCVKRKWI